MALFVKKSRSVFRLVFFIFLPVWVSSWVLAESPQKIEIWVDSFKIAASERLAGRVDTNDLRLVGQTILGDTARHRWIFGFKSLELRFEESYPSFPAARFFRCFTPNLVVPPGNLVGIDRNKGKAYLIYQSGAKDDLEEMAGEQGIKISSDSAALEYFVEVLQLRGYFPSIILDTVAELRQYARYKERAVSLKASELPPPSRFYRHLWRDRSFVRFRKGKLPEREEEYKQREKAWISLIRSPQVTLPKDIYSIKLYLARTKDLFSVYEISGFVFQNGAVHYSVVPIKL